MRENRPSTRSESASVRLHLACGFHEVGRLERVGVKFGRALDSVLMRRALGDL